MESRDEDEIFLRLYSDQKVKYQRMRGQQARLLRRQKKSDVKSQVQWPKMRASQMKRCLMEVVRVSFSRGLLGTSSWTGTL